MILNTDAQVVLQAAKDFLAERGCAGCVPEAMLERYAVASARWAECEEHISKYGLLIKSSTGKATASPYVEMAQGYYKQANDLWLQICRAAEAARPGLF